MDTLSQEAYKLDRVRTTIWGEAFTDFLPLYINHEHFERALPTIRVAIVKLAPDWRTGGRFEPEMVLDVLPNIGAELLARLNRQKLLSEQRCVLLPEGIYKQKGIAVPELEPEAERRQRGLMVVLVSVVFAFDDVLSNVPVDLVAHYDGHRGDDRW